MQPSSVHWRHHFYRAQPDAEKPLSSLSLSSSFFLILLSDSLNDDPVAIISASASLFRALTSYIAFQVKLETEVHPKVRNHGEGPY